MPESTLRSFNERGIELRAQGKLREAIAAFSEGIVQFPNAAVLYNNLAMTLDELGASQEALLAYESALMRAPGWPPAAVGKATLLLRDGKIDEARAAYDLALASEPDSVPANLGLYELLQIKGDLEGAVLHQRRALERQQLFVHVAPREARSLLVLCAPGDWQANIPIDFLIDRSVTTVYKLYLLDEARVRGAQLPHYDVVLNAIAESPVAGPYLELAERFVQGQSRPSLNASARVLSTSRRSLPQTLADVDCTVAPVAQLGREALERGDLPFAFPVIARPVGSHAGHDLVRAADAGELAEYARTAKGAAFYASPFLDYSSEDGYFRKFRFVYVDGEPFPVHLAVSQRWMIHYYNAPMADHRWMRDEEARFLAGPREVLGPRAWAAVEAVAPAVGLEYFGIDAALDRDGRLVVFEADPAMLVHTTDPQDLYPYKHEFIPRIYRALERRIDRRKGADTN